MMDRNRPITNEDLIRRYDLESLKANRKAIKNNKQGLDKTDGILNQFILSVLNGMSNTDNQVDGKVTTWFYNYVPTTSNAPASGWATDSTKNSHIGDLFYDQDNGYVYVYGIVNNAYTWTRVEDDSTVQAMVIANANPDTSDGYRDIFVIQPTTPYKVGDIWFKEDGDVYRCTIARASGDFNPAEWVLASEYSNDDYVNDARAIIDEFKETITENYICKVIVKTTRDSIEFTVSGVMSGGKVTAASIKLAINNDTSNIKIEADNIDINGVVSANNNFKILTDGSMEAQNGVFKGKIKSSYMTGDTENVKVLIGTDTDGYASTDNCFDILCSDNFKILGVFCKRFPNNIQATYFRTDSNKGFRFLGDVSCNKLELNDSNGYSANIYVEHNAGDGDDVVYIPHRINSQAVADNTSSSAPNGYITTNGYFARSTSSSKRYKADIQDLKDEELDVKKLLDVPIRQFKYKDGYIKKTDKRYKKNIPGLIVEELEEHFPIAVDYNEDNQPEMWNNQILVPSMLKLIQDQAKKIDNLEKEINALKERRDADEHN